MFALKIKSYKNWLTSLSFFLLFASLSFSKGLSTVTEVALIILSLDKIFSKSIFNQIWNQKVLFIFSLFFMVLVFGLFWSENWIEGLKVIRHQHRWVVIPLLFLVHLDFVKKNSVPLLFTFVSVASAAALFTIVLSFLPEHEVISLSGKISFLQTYPITNHRFAFGMYSPFIDRLQFSNLLGIAVITLVYLILNKKLKIGFVFLFVPLIYCSLILGGRGGQIALFAGIFIYILRILYVHFFRKMSKKWSEFKSHIILLGSTFLLFVIITVGLFNVNQQLKLRYNQMIWELSTFEDGTYEQFDYIHFTSVRRVVSWTHLWQIFTENPILGVGTGDVIDELQKKYNTDKYIFPVNIHSQYLYILAGWGLVGFIVFFGSWGYWLFSFRNNGYLFDFALVFTSFSLVSMLSDGILIKQIDLMAFIVFIVLIGILNKKEQKEYV